MDFLVSPPGSVDELMTRAGRLSGRTLGWIAAQHAFDVPEDLTRSKGWVGQLIESVLGATAASRPEPDFPHLGVELKTLPVDATGKPFESTYVCTAPLDGSLPARWEDSWVCQKLARVLWIPVLGDPKIPVADRMVGSGVLWTPSEEENEALRQDWLELSEMVLSGKISQINARLGKVIQIRPKAASASSRTWMMDEDASWVRVNPRGFYLRPSFTRNILRQHFVLKSRS